jgi:hypothetical protein
MKVMCITEDWVTIRGTGHEPRPNFGEVDDVIGDFVHDDEQYYFLARFGTEHAYGKRHFVSLSEIDEVEMTSESKTIYVYETIR